MPGRLGLDFGSSNTIAALWDAAAGDGRTLPLANLTRVMRDPQQRELHAVPSLMHYFGPTGVWVGQQVIEKQLQTATPGTFRWMKTYVGSRMLLPRQVDGRTLDNFQVAGDFLRQILIAAGAQINLAEEDVAVTVPVEAFEHYQNWLDEVVQSAGVLRPRYLDEASAAALGYTARIRAGAPFMTFDLGGGTLDVSIVRLEDTPGGQPRCRCLGKAGAQVGGGAIDQWLARDVLNRADFQDTAKAIVLGRGVAAAVGESYPERVALRWAIGATGGLTEAQARALFPLLLQEAERVKEALTAAEAETFDLKDPKTGLQIQHRYSRGAFEDLLEANGLYTKINAVLDAAEGQAREHGYDKDQLQAVLMIGGSSLIPSIRRLVRARYGERVRCERPFDAVAVGAAAYVAGAGFDDRIRHAYALRPFDRASGQYAYKTIVRAGTPYPCEIMRPNDPKQPLVLTIMASHDQQTKLGLQVYEVAERSSVACGGGGLDLVFDQNGAARYVPRADEADVTHREIGSATFIHCQPPAQKSAPRFLATFAIDDQRHLCVTVQDTLTGKTLHRKQRMVKLT